MKNSNDLSGLVSHIRYVHFVLLTVCLALFVATPNISNNEKITQALHDLGQLTNALSKIDDDWVRDYFVDIKSSDDNFIVLNTKDDAESKGIFHSPLGVYRLRWIRDFHLSRQKELPWSWSEVLLEDSALEHFQKYLSLLRLHMIRPSLIEHNDENEGHVPNLASYLFYSEAFPETMIQDGFLTILGKSLQVAEKSNGDIKAIATSYTLDEIVNMWTLFKEDPHVDVKQLNKGAIGGYTQYQYEFDVLLSTSPNAEPTTLYNDFLTDDINSATIYTADEVYESYASYLESFEMEEEKKRLVDLKNHIFSSSAYYILITGNWSNGSSGGLRFVYIPAEIDFTQGDLLAHFVKGSGMRLNRFKVEFPELFELTENFSSSTLFQIEKMLKSPAFRSSKELEIFSAKIPLQSITSIGAIVVVLLQLYFLLHLNQFRELSIQPDSKWTTPWIGLYGQQLARVAVYGSVLFAPLVTILMLLTLAIETTEFWMSMEIIITVICIISSALLLYFISATYRAIRLQIDTHK